MKKIKKITNVLALCTIVGLSCWIGYLLSLNEQKAVTIEMYEAKDSTFNRLLEVDKMQDSIISSMPEYLPKGWEVDSNGVYNIN